MSTDAELEEHLDRIYGGEPADFTRARDELAKSLKERGDDRAAAVKQLRRPTQAAAAINRLALTHESEIGRLLEAGAELRRVQEQLGEPDAGERLKAASAEQRDAIDAVLAIAADELGVSGATLDRISETLHGTASDEALAETVRAGRVEREGQATGLGGPVVVPTSAGARKPKRNEKRRSDGPSARERKRAERAVEKAESKLETAEEAETEARARVRSAEEDLKAARATHDGSEKTLERARKAAAEARRELEEMGSSQT